MNVKLIWSLNWFRLHGPTALVADPWLVGWLVAFRVFAVPLDQLTVWLWLTWQRDVTPRSDVTALQPWPWNPCPSICLVRPRGFIDGDISRFVCLFLSSAACGGSVAGRGCHRAGGGGGRSVKELIHMNTWSLALRLNPGEPLTHLLFWCASAMQLPSLLRFNSLQVSNSSPHNSSWFP